MTMTIQEENNDPTERMFMTMKQPDHGNAQVTTPDKIVQPPMAESMMERRPRDPFLTQDEAYHYASSLPPERRTIVPGCYVVRCVYRDMIDCPIACLYNLVCCDRTCLWPGIGTIPFGCCISCICFDGNNHYENIIKHDTIITKVDDATETLACYSNGCPPGPCCYCEKKC